MTGLSLHNKKFNVVRTAPNGVVNEHTIFIFSHVADVVSAEYAGGRIKKGFLVGKIRDGIFQFTYCQLQDDGKLDHGSSSCLIEVNAANKIRIVENFEWSSRDGEKGQNIFEEL